jgi:Na+/proline symporter
VFTAYEYLEQRFDLKNRVLGSILFLIQRGLAAGFTIFAPSLIISLLLGIDIRLTICVIGLSVIVYTTMGGTDAVNRTHLLQMVIITVGMLTALVMILKLLPSDISLLDATRVAGKMGRLNPVSFRFEWTDRYNIWTGIIGGTFLSLSYFGTDQSQVQRYLSGRSVRESRIGLLANGIVKIPMQFTILFIGVLVYVFYQFTVPPLHFNTVNQTDIKTSAYAESYSRLEEEHSRIHGEKQQQIRKLLSAMKSKDSGTIDATKDAIERSRASELQLRDDAVALIETAKPGADTNDTDYIFLYFVINNLPIGLVGLVLAAILSASMSSTAAELNALASTTVIDIYKRLIKKEGKDRHYLAVSRWATVFWGAYAIAFALFVNHLGSLIEAVNILGSLFYGTILGLFLVAFYFKRICATATFIGAIVTELIVLSCYFFTEIPYLWYNVIGPVVLIILACAIHPLCKEKA